MERHLKKCGKCRQHYKEMTGKLPDILPKAEADSVKLLKKERKRRRKIRAVIKVLCFLLFMAVLTVMPRDINYKDVQLEYGMNGNKAYVSMRPKPYVGGIVFNGEVKTSKDIAEVALRFPGISGVMTARGILSRPSLIAEYEEGQDWDREKRIDKMLEFHGKLLHHYESTLCGDSQILSKIKPFWEYAEEEIGRKAWKMIKKASNMAKYHSAVAMI